MKKSWVAAEAIDFQAKNKLQEPLAALIGEIRRGGEFTSEAFSAIGIPALISDHTGLSVKFNVSNTPLINASVFIPQLDKNNPILANMRRVFATNEDLEKVNKFVKGRFTGIFDRKEGKVYGDFTKITSVVNITTGLLKYDKMSDHEITAVILHELGHLSSYFERLIDVVSVNYAVISAVERLLKLERDTDRVELLLEFDKYVGVNVPDKDTIVKSDNRGTLHSHLVCEVVKQRRNEEGDEIYSYRGFEFSADQFAVRHGAGKYLVTSLDKIHRKQWFNPSYISWPMHVMIQLVKVLFHVVVTNVALRTNPVILFMNIVLLLTARPMNKIYDEPAERFSRIEREMLSELKNRNMTDVRREEIMNNLAVVRDVAKDVNDKRGLFEAMWAYVIPAGNENRKRMEFQQLLENFANNQLFEASAKFK